MRALIIAAFALLAIPTLALADTTVTLDPLSGAVPNTVSYTNDLTGGCDLYFEEGAAPIADNEDGAVCGTTGTLNTETWDNGSFDGATPGDYQFVQPRTVGCYNLSYADCAAANTEIPGALEADFTLISGTSTSTSTSTLSASDALLTYLLFVLDALWFAACFVVVIAAFKYTFNLS